MASNGRNGRKKETVSLIAVCKESSKKAERVEQPAVTTSGSLDGPAWLNDDDSIGELKEKMPSYVGVVVTSGDRILGDSQSGWTRRENTYLNRYNLPTKGEPFSFRERGKDSERYGVYAGTVRDVYEMSKDDFDALLNGLADEAEAKELKAIADTMKSHSSIESYPDLRGLVKDEIEGKLEREIGELGKDFLETRGILVKLAEDREAERIVFVPEPLKHFRKCMDVRGTLDALKIGLKNATRFLNKYSDLSQWGNLAHLTGKRSETSVMEIMGKDVNDTEDRRRINDLMVRRNAILSLRSALERRFAEKSKVLDEVDLPRLFYDLSEEEEEGEDSEEVPE